MFVTDVLHGVQAAWPVLLCLANYGATRLLAGKRGA
jgi:hypothetical protein